MAIDYSEQDWRLEDYRLADPYGDESEAEQCEDVEELADDDSDEWAADDELAAQHDA